MPFPISRKFPEWSSFVLFGIAIAVLLFALFADWIPILKALGFPVQKLRGERGQADLAIFRSLISVIAVFLATAQFVLWRSPGSVVKIAQRIRRFISDAARLPVFTVLFLTAVVLMKSVLQMSLYLIGYTAYAGDDFSRVLKADCWLQHYQHLGWPGWLGVGFTQLPFPDYLFGLGLALHRDLYITPKFVNLILSGILVIVAYFLGRGLFGRSAGFLTALLAAFMPWNVWLGLSGMTSDLSSVVTIAAFGYFLCRWLKTNRTQHLFAAAGCLFVADGMRYENWFFSVAFSLLVIFIIARRWRDKAPVPLSAAIGALALANAFPVIYMAASYYVSGNWIPAAERLDQLFDSVRQPIPQINIPLLVLSAFPFEFTATMAGVVLVLKGKDNWELHRSYLFIVGAAFLMFVGLFFGRVITAAGPQRYLLPHMVLLLPYAAFLLTHLLRPQMGRDQRIIVGCAILLALGTFNIVRAFNYPAKRYDRDAFHVGWTLRTLEDIGSIQTGRILVEKGERWVPFPILALVNGPEKFTRLDEGKVGQACDKGFQGNACQAAIQSYHLMILSSADKVLDFKKMFNGRSWQIGKYHVFELNASTKQSTNSRDSSRILSGTPESWSRCWLLGERTD